MNTPAQRNLPQVSAKGTLIENSEYSFGSTSNDLLFKLDPKLPHSYLKYQVIAQNREEVQDIQNAPSISMSTYLTDSAQTQLLTTISVYSQRGESTDQIRITLYEHCCVFCMA